MKRKVAIYCDKLYAGDILWGFTDGMAVKAIIITPGFHRGL
jgi:hypothetical protein